MDTTMVVATHVERHRTVGSSKGSPGLGRMKHGSGWKAQAATPPILWGCPSAVKQTRAPWVGTPGEGHGVGGVMRFSPPGVTWPGTAIVVFFTRGLTSTVTLSTFR
jgi:hypothetical protein